MAQMQVQGLEEYAERLGSLYKDSEQIIKESVYEGASVVADSIKSGLKSLPVDNGQGTERVPELMSSDKSIQHRWMT